MGREWNWNGIGKTEIEAPSLDEARKRFKDGDCSKEDEEIEDSDNSIETILNVETGKYEYSELDEILQLQLLLDKSFVSYAS